MTQEQQKLFEHIVQKHKDHGGIYNWQDLDKDFTASQPDKLVVNLRMLDGYITKTPYGTMLTDEGWAFTSFEDINRKKEQHELKHWYETENARNVFEDYPNVKSRLIRSEWTSIFAIIVAAIGIMQPWICNKPG